MNPMPGDTTPDAGQPSTPPATDMPGQDMPAPDTNPMPPTDMPSGQNQEDTQVGQ
ncbi:hypothetical protein HY469_00555 [Candidatus Roizmanbacteria bacterium]|nr:hypothetical protein [Candidatus Roizmanbacteria bacterium]